MQLHSRTLAILVIPALLSACAWQGAEVTALPTRIDYVCLGNKILPVARVPDSSMAAVIVDGKEYLLRGGLSAAQEKYSDGAYTLYLDGEQAMLEHNGRVLLGPCRSPVPLPTYYRTR